MDSQIYATKSNSCDHESEACHGQCAPHPWRYRSVHEIHAKPIEGDRERRMRTWKGIPGLRICAIEMFRSRALHQFFDHEHQAACEYDTDEKSGQVCVLPLEKENKTKAKRETADKERLAEFRNAYKDVDAQCIAHCFKRLEDADVERGHESAAR